MHEPIHHRRLDTTNAAALIMTVVLTILLAAHGCGSSEVKAPSSNLAPHMSDLHRYTDKLGYAIDARNDALAGYYLDEVEQTLAEIQTDFPQYEGRNIASLAKSLTVPKIQPLRTALKNPDWQSTRSAYSALVESCNQCHAATFRQFIRINEATGTPPWSQRFTPTQ